MVLCINRSIHCIGIWNYNCNDKKQTVKKSISPSEKNSEELVACVSGQLIPLEEVNDPVFSTGIMGQGIAICPDDNNIYAPCDGIVTVVYSSKHAICITSDEGADILIHIGIETVRLDGKHFENYVEVNSRVKKGDKIAYFDREKIAELNIDTTVVMLVTNSDKSAVYVERKRNEI